jgi:N-carbamoylputrescine amidase
MLVAGVQMACGEAKSDNVAKAIRFIEDAAQQGARLVCLQEVFATEFFPCRVDAKFFAWAEPVDGETIGTLRGVARRLQVWILGSLFERDPEISGRFYNAAVLLDPRGEITGRYRKSYIPYRAQNTERYYFTPGNLRFPVFQVEDLTIGVNICYDRHFPELARIMALKGAHLLVYPTASKADVGRANTWIPEMISRATENVFYVLGVNRCGVEGPYRYFGHSVLVNPYGQEVAGLKEDEGLVLGEVRADEVDRARYDYAHLRDLRLDVYQELVRLMYAEPAS